MRALTCIFLLAVYTSANAKDTCGPDTLEWPSGTKECAVQLLGTSKVGESRSEGDPSHPGSDATFRCTKNGWVVVREFCPTAKSKKNEIDARLSCMNEVSQYSEYSHTPPHILPNIPHDILYEYSKPASGTFVLPDPKDRGAWHIFGPNLSKKLNLKEVKDKYVALDVGDSKRIVFWHGYKASTIAGYPASMGKVYEELGWWSASDDQLKTRMKDAKAMPMAITEGVEAKSLAVLDEEILRRLKGVSANFDSGRGESDSGMTREQIYESHLDAMWECRMTGNPAIGAEVDAQTKSLQHSMNKHRVGNAKIKAVGPTPADR